MRALCLLVVLGVLLPGCCSTHRAWSEGYNSCVPQCDQCGDAPHQSCLFQKRSSRARCSHGSPCGDPCGFSCGDCGTGCGSACGDCSSCGDSVITGGMSCRGCSNCSPEQTVYSGSTDSAMPYSSTCPTCQQGYPVPAGSQTVAPPPPTPAAAPANPMPNAPEPHAARTLQPLQMQPIMQPLMTQPAQMPLIPSQSAQPVQYQEWQPHQSLPPGATPYTPAAAAVAPQTAVQPVLWVPAQAQIQAPLTVPAR